MERNREWEREERHLPFIYKVEAFVCQREDVLFHQMCFLAGPHGRSRLGRRCVWALASLSVWRWRGANGLFAAIWLINTWKGPSGSRVLIVVIGVNKVSLHALITSIVSSRRANWVGLYTDGGKDGSKRGTRWWGGGEGDLAVKHATCFCMVTPCSPCRELKG